MPSTTKPTGPTTQAAALRNWCGSHELAAASQVLRPRDETELGHILRDSAGARIQILGSRYSWPGLITADEGLVIDSSALSGVISLGDHTIEVFAGTPLHDIHSALAEVNRRLAYSPPVILGQTVGGAIATGTHGQGLGTSTIGDALRELTVFGLDGQASRITGDHPHFGAYRLNLGCLGILTRVVLPTVPNQVLTCEKLAVPYRTFLAEFPGWQRHYAYCKAWWFPDDDKAHVWLIRNATRHEARSYYRNQRPVTHGFPNHTLDDAVAHATDRMRTDTRTTDLSADQFHTVRRFTGFSDTTGRLDDLVCKGIPVPQINCEIGIPLDQFAAAQDDLERWHQTRRPSMHYPFILRATGPSQAWLSPAYQRETCYYGMLVYQASDGTFSGSSYASLRAAQRILTGHSGLPHWGKYFDPDALDRRLLPRWDDFQTVRTGLDPGGRLLNPDLNTIFRTGADAARA